jgi:hypothetical protein
MKKILLPLATLLLVSFLMVGMAQAASVTVSVTTVPETMIPGETTTITVTCDQDASGSITVITPSGDSYSKSISVSAGGSVSVAYPDDFVGADSIEIGPYQITVFLSGEEFMASFYVSFEVHTIPDFPIVGTAGATVAMLAGLGLYKVKRRRPE